MTLQELRDQHELERVGYYRLSWNPVKYVVIAANTGSPTGTPNHRWLVSEPKQGQWLHYYLDPQEAEANDWSFIDEDIMDNYAIAQHGMKNPKNDYTQ